MSKWGEEARARSEIRKRMLRWKKENARMPEKKMGEYCKMRVKQIKAGIIESHEVDAFRQTQSGG